MHEQDFAKIREIVEEEFRKNRLNAEKGIDLLVYWCKIIIALLLVGGFYFVVTRPKANYCSHHVHSLTISTPSGLLSN
jgi:hypothetical protein